MIPETIPLLVQRYFAATRAMDVNAWLVCFADNAASHDPYGGQPVQGKEELRTFFLTIATAFKEIGFTENFVTVVGNRAAVKFTARGTGKNGKTASGEGIDIFEFNDRGTIQTMWGYWDPAAMMAQLQG